MSLNPTASPLTTEQLSELQRFTAKISADQLLWVSGYLAGLTSSQAISSQPADSAAEKITILYASQTGNGQKIAARLQQNLTGFEVNLLDVADYKRSQLKQEKILLMIASTHGEGDPPDLAVEFHQFLMGKKAPRLEGLRYAVLALGDTSYANYCKTGKEFDQRFGELGATALVERVDCDVDYETDAEQWIEQVRAALMSATVTETVSVASVPIAAAADHNRRNPFSAELLDNIVLSGRGSAKQVHHLELSLAGSGIRYQPGDAVGVVPQNPPGLVNRLLDQLAVAGDDEIAFGEETVTLEQALSSRVEISSLSRPVVDAYNQFAQSDELKQLLDIEQADELQEWMYDRDLLDLITDFPVGGLDVADLIAALRKLQPRLYSIASSPLVDAEEVHLTVAAVQYRARGRDRVGAASGWITAIQDGSLPVYVDENPNFRLPVDTDQDIIMIGPGTGIAPFRAFVDERAEQGASGRNWLFFGDQHFHTDFLYQREWQAHLKSGALSRLSLAFSRDQAEKIYVQHRIREQGRELFQWIDDGASIYLCGDSSRMAVDVNDMLLQVIAEQGGLSATAAHEYLLTMQKDKRYQKDVY